jgi:hypothetical protein
MNKILILSLTVIIGALLLTGCTPKTLHNKIMSLNVCLGGCGHPTFMGTSDSGIMYYDVTPAANNPTNGIRTYPLEKGDSCKQFLNDEYQTMTEGLSILGFNSDLIGKEDYHGLTIITLKDSIGSYYWLCDTIDDTRMVELLSEPYYVAYKEAS